MEGNKSQHLLNMWRQSHSRFDPRCNYKQVLVLGRRLQKPDLLYSMNQLRLNVKRSQMEKVGGALHHTKSLQYFPIDQKRGISIPTFQ